MKIITYDTKQYWTYRTTDQSSEINGGKMKDEKSICHSPAYSMYWESGTELIAGYLGRTDFLTTKSIFMEEI